MNTHARTHACMHACTHARTHARPRSQLFHRFYSNKHTYAHSFRAQLSYRSCSDSKQQHLILDATHLTHLILDAPGLSVLQRDFLRPHTVICPYFCAKHRVLCFAIRCRRRFHLPSGTSSRLRFLLKDSTLTDPHVPTNTSCSISHPRSSPIARRPPIRLSYCLRATSIARASYECLRSLVLLNSMR